MTDDMVADKRAKNTTYTSFSSKKRQRPKKRDYDLFGEPYNNVRGETALWIAVITQAMMDALSRSGQAEARYHKHEAIRWLSDNGKDFITVCHNAGLDPDYVRRKAKKALISPSSWRAAPGKGKRYLERKSYRARLKSSAKTPPSSNPPQESGTQAQILTGAWA